jgi:hypothetical protein
MKSTILVALLVVLILAGCQHSNTDNKRRSGDRALPPPPTLLPPKGQEREYAVLPFAEKPDTEFENSKPSVLSTAEVDKVYQLVESAALANNRKYKGSIKLEEYRLQLVPVLMADGNKGVWVNAFCSDIPTNWQTRRVWTHDGGDCYFQVSLNLSQGKWYEFHVNGDA